MRRNAFTMKLKPGFEAEYKKRHDAVFPELLELLQSNGVRDYSIFLDEKSHTLFAYQILEDHFDESRILESPIVWKWWAYMADIMETNTDFSPISGSLIEVFHVD